MRIGAPSCHREAMITSVTSCPAAALLVNACPCPAIFAVSDTSVPSASGGDKFAVSALHGWTAGHRTPRSLLSQTHRVGLFAESKIGRAACRDRGSRAGAGG